MGPQTDFGGRKTEPTELREAHPCTSSRPTRLKTNDQDGAPNHTANAADERRALTAPYAEAEGATPRAQPSGSLKLVPSSTSVGRCAPPLPRRTSLHTRHRSIAHQRNLMRRAHAAGPLGQGHATSRGSRGFARTWMRREGRCREDAAAARWSSGDREGTPDLGFSPRPVIEGTTGGGDRAWPPRGLRSRLAARSALALSRVRTVRRGHPAQGTKRWRGSRQP
jgi:hypothetical protein